MEIVGTVRSPAHTSPTQIMGQVQKFVPIIPLLYILCTKTIAKSFFATKKGKAFTAMKVLKRKNAKEYFKSNGNCWYC